MQQHVYKDKSVSVHKETERISRKQKHGLCFEMQKLLSVLNDRCAH
jgi:hypothetical protein